MTSEGEPPWRLVITRAAARQLARLRGPEGRRILAALERLVAADPLLMVERVVGANPPEHRLRVGGWRVIVRLEEASRTVTVLRVGRRGQVYRRGG